MFTVRRAFIVAPGVLIIAAGSTQSLAQYSFQRLGMLVGGRDSSAHGVSADGSIVVGRSSYSFTDAGGPHVGSAGFRFDRSTGIMSDLGLLTTLYPSYEFANAASADGGVVVGLSSSGPPSYLNSAFRWTGPGVYPSIPLPPGMTEAWAYAVSADGDVVAGTARVAGRHSAYRYRVSTGAFDVTRSSAGDRDSGISGVDASGAVLVGSEDYDSFWWSQRTIRWAPPAAPQSLGFIQGPHMFSAGSGARAISADGSTIVGLASDNDNATSHVYEAFRWREGTGMVGLGSWDGTDTQAYDCSADGETIVGYSSGPGLGYGSQALIWRGDGPPESLQQLLLNAGVKGLEGWTLEIATSISDDGTVIAGWGLNPKGESEAWVVTIPPPGPACPCDWNADTFVNSQDFFDFLGDFFVGDADYNGSGSTDSQDFFDFLGCFFTGCG